MFSGIAVVLASLQYFIVLAHQPSKELLTIQQIRSTHTEGINKHDETEDPRKMHRRLQIEWQQGLAVDVQDLVSDLGQATEFESKELSFEALRLNLKSLDLKLPPSAAGISDLLPSSSWNIPPSMCGRVQTQELQNPNRKVGFLERWSTAITTAVAQRALSLSSGNGGAIYSSHVREDVERSGSGFMGVYAGWLGQTNMGDEILADIFLDFFTMAVREAAFSTTQITVKKGSPVTAHTGWRGCSLSNVKECDFGVLGGGSTVSVDYLRHVLNLSMSGRPVIVFGSGHQSEPRPSRRTDAYMRKLCQYSNGSMLGGVRGYYTRTYLAEFGCTHDSLPVLRDSALLAGKLYTDGKSVLRDQLQQYAGKRHVIVATPFGEHTFPIFNQTLHFLLHTKQFAVVLQPVDELGHSVFKGYAENIKKSLPTSLQPHLLLHDEFQDWGAILDLYRHASASLSSRLHSGVLSLAAGRPSIFLASNKKYGDLLGSINMRDLLLHPRNAQVGQAEAFSEGFARQLTRKVVDVVRRSAETGKHMESVFKDMWHHYTALMGDFMRQLRDMDPERYQATLCCHHISITRSLPSDRKVLIKVQCMDSQ